MAELAWVATTPLAHVLKTGRHGADSGAAGVICTGLHDFELLQIMARRGKAAALAKAAKQLFGATAPVKPQAVAAGNATLIWSGPDQFLALAPRQAGSPLLDASARSLAGIASISDQSDGRALIRIAGASACDALAKFCSLDLDPSVFPAGSAASTSIDHTAATLWRGKDEGGAPVFFLLVFTSFAESLWHMMLESGLEFGVEVGAASFLA